MNGLNMSLMKFFMGLRQEMDFRMIFRMGMGKSKKQD